MPWIQAHLTTRKALAPVIELLFEHLGAVSVTLSDAADEALLEPAPGESPLWQQTRISGLFPGDTDMQRLHSQIGEAAQPGACGDLQLERLQDRSWERVWLENFHPLRFGRRLWVCPAGQRPPLHANDVVVDLDPGLAFGTGTHQTTALCLGWLDSADLRGKTVIDFGCGSGILAIAALKLGAAQVVAVDHDPQALYATRDNAEKNAVLEQLQIRHSKQLPDIRADLLLANILAGTLIELEPLLADHCRGGGTILLSGILEEQQQAVADAYTGDFQITASETRDEWLLLEARRR
jgi:ribosomal protein L11 methyltransferase